MNARPRSPVRFTRQAPRARRMLGAARRSSPEKSKGRGRRLAAVPTPGTCIPRCRRSRLFLRRDAWNVRYPGSAHRPQRPAFAIMSEGSGKPCWDPSRWMKSYGRDPGEVPGSRRRSGRPCRPSICWKCRSRSSSIVEIAGDRPLNVSAWADFPAAGGRSSDRRRRSRKRKDVSSWWPARI